MAIKTYNDQNFVAIANAIRAKNGETTQYKPSEMAAAISALETALEILPQDTVSGAIANFPDGSNNYPVVELIANIDPKQAGSGDPSPSNVRPISGSTECKITKALENLVNVSDISGSINNAYFYAFSTGYTLTADTTYTLAMIVNTSVEPFAISVGVGDSSGYRADIAYTAINLKNGLVKLEFTPTSNMLSNWSTLWIRAPRYSTPTESYQTTATFTLKNILVYSQAETKTIDLGRTVYGGTLNVTTGELTVTHGIKTFNGSESWNTYGNYNGFSISVSTMKSGVRQDGVCNMLKRSTTSTQGQTNAFWLGVNTKVIYIIGVYESMGNTLEAFKEYLSTHNLTFVFPLETPETYQLEPEEVKTLLGVNNIYADTGDVEVTYRADIDRYIAKKIAEGA